MVTDKSIMEQYYNYALNSLNSAYDNLNKAKEILNSDLLLDDEGYAANELAREMDIIYKYKEKITTNVLPAIEKL